ncbi:cilia- and flagella-associated protein 53 isoform X1 [Festucalex cinctus]
MLPARRAMQLRQQHEAARVREDEARACRVNNAWLLSGDARNVRRAVRRDVDDVMTQHLSSVHQRQQRLRDLLDEDERRLTAAAARLERDSPRDKHERMRRRAEGLADAREAQRRQVAHRKLDLLFRAECQELGEAQSRRHLARIAEERGAQLRGQQEERERRRLEDATFGRMWRADALAKEERERRRAEEARRRGRAQGDFLRRQMADGERTRQRRQLARLEEARQQEEEASALQREAERKRAAEREALAARRRALDRSVRLKTARVAGERQEELRREADVLRQTLQEETRARRETADRRAETRAQQIRFGEYVTELTARRQQAADEAERATGERVKEARDRRDAETRLRQDARRRLLEDVLDGRRLQTQRKQQADAQRRADAAEERAETDAAARDAERAEREAASRCVAKTGLRLAPPDAAAAPPAGGGGPRRRTGRSCGRRWSDAGARGRSSGRRSCASGGSCGGWSRRSWTRRTKFWPDPAKTTCTRSARKPPLASSASDNQNKRRHSASDLQSKLIF